MGDELYLEVHPPLENEEGARGPDMTTLMLQYVKVTQEQNAEVDWQRVTEVFEEKLGIPVSVGTAVSLNVSPGPDILVQE